MSEERKPYHGRSVDRLCFMDGHVCDNNCRAFIGTQDHESCFILETLDDFRAAARTFVARRLPDIMNNERVARIARKHEEWRKRNPDYDPDKESLVDYWDRKYFGG